MKRAVKKRIALFLAFCLVIGLSPMQTKPMQANAAEDGTAKVTVADHSAAAKRLASQVKGNNEKLPTPEEYFQPEDMVRAMVVLEDPSLSELGFQTFGMDTAENVSVQAIEKQLIQKQDEVLSRIQSAVANGARSTMEVNYNFTKAVNGISVTVPFKSLEEIRKIEGVKKAFVMPVYSVPEDQESTGSMIYQEYAWTNGFKGEGMKVAIVDTGLDTDHKSFAAAPPLTGDSLNKSTLAIAINAGLLHSKERLPEITENDVYLSEKVPYAFNYVDKNLTVDHSKDTQGDHGTHVAGIVAANPVEGELAVGVAPNAQLLVMKVFGAKGGAYMDDILAAVEDAAVLGADVVNLSLGSPSGFSDESEEYNTIFARVFELGTFAAISAGNEYTAGLLNQYGLNLSLASNPDNGVVGSPSTYSEATSVASIENTTLFDYYIESDGHRYSYMDTSTNEEYAELKIQGFLETLGGKAYEVALVDPTVHGYGATVEEFEAAGVEGKIALVQRGGGVNFTDKQLNAQKAGAVACIIFNSTSGQFGINFTGGKATLACATISLNAGTAIAEACWAVSGTSESVMIYVSDTQGVTPSEQAYQMSDFSSLGATPDLALRPDITAPGGNIYSTLDGGVYGDMSGTSMAAPKLAGSAALLLQKLKENPSVSKAERKVLADRILMSTADPVIDLSLEYPYYYSPRKQGSGLVNIEKALTTKAYLTVPGSEKPKAELGDDESKTGVYQYTFMVNNMSNEDLYYALDTFVQTEMPSINQQLQEIFMSGLPFGLDNYAVVTYSSANQVSLGRMEAAVVAAEDGTITSVSNEFVWSEEGEQIKSTLDSSEDFVIKVPANGIATVSVQIELEADAKAFLDACFENGIYVEGFTFLKDLLGGVNLSLPYLAFYGDWTQAPIFDAAFAWDRSAMPSQYSHAIFLDGGIFGLAYPGMNVFTGEVDLERAAVSPNGDGIFDNMDDMYLSLLRNAKELNIIFSNADTGEVIEVLPLDYIRKSTYRSNYGQIVPFIYSWYYYPYDFTYEAGPDDWQMIPENTKVKVTVEASGDFDKFGGRAPEVLDFGVSFLIDVTEPELVGTKSEASADGKFLNVTVKDNGYIQAAMLFDQEGELIGNLSLDGQVPNQPMTLTIPAEYVTEPVFLDLIDYAGNIAEYEIQYVEATPTPTPTPYYPPVYPVYPTATPTPAPTATPEPTETPTPSVPIEEPVPVVGTEVKDDLLWVEVTLSEEDEKAIVEKQETLGEGEDLEISVVIPENITEVSEEIKNVVIVVGFSQQYMENGIPTMVILPEKLIENAKEREINLTVELLDEEQNAQVIWKFDAEQLAASDKDLTDVYLRVEVKSAKEEEVLAKDIADALEETAQVVDFTHKGILPATAEITIQTGFAEGSTVYLYYYNEEKGCLDELPANEYTIGEDGKIVFHIIHCSKYVLSAKKVETARSLGDQIEAVTGKKNLYVGGTAGNTVDVKPTLPITLKESKDLSATLEPAVMAVKITYASDKPSVATVDENGVVTAVKRGSATITATAELADGTVKTFEVPVNVSKASAKLVLADQTYTVGSRISVSLELKGYDPKEIRWMTSRRSIAVVRRNTGKTKAVVVAKSAGTDWIVVYAGDKQILRAKIVIKEVQPEGEVQ